MHKKLGFAIFKAALSALLYIAFILAVAGAGNYCYQFMYKAFSNPVCDETSYSYKTITVKKGEDSLRIMKELSDKNVIEDYHTAYMRYHFSKYSGLIKQGTYKVSASMPLDTVLGVLAGDAKTTEDADSIEASAGVLEDELSDDTQGGE